MKVYYYKYIFVYPNLKEEEREFFTTNVEELIKTVKSNKDKWYIQNEEVYIFKSGEKIDIKNVLNPFQKRRIVNMERWNPENMMYINTDEYRYLYQIRELICSSEEITKELNKIWDWQRYSIQCGKEKYIHNFDDIKSKLKELRELLDE